MTGPAGPQQPPELPGFTFRSVLGRGGFADVFLFEQNRARRDVAVKVLRERVDPGDRAQITAEAEVMAQLSTHPYIVTIYDADISPDGRPYLVMEYYSRPNLARRARSQGFDVPEVLRVGVQVASAVETAHRAGIIHRDIKPANILTSDYGRPGLTDFGIASRTEGGAGEAGGGLTVPWAAPELFHEDVVPDHRADVYALGATLWTLLVGRSPFEAPDGDNGELAMWCRIENSPVPVTGRGDAPDSLERVLRQSMAKQPGQRFASALELARALQSIQGELHLAVEPVALPDLAITTSRGSRPALPQPPDPASPVTLLRAPRPARGAPPAERPGPPEYPSPDLSPAHPSPAHPPARYPPVPATVGAPPSLVSQVPGSFREVPGPPGGIPVQPPEPAVRLPGRAGELPAGRGPVGPGPAGPAAPGGSRWLVAGVTVLAVAGSVAGGTAFLTRLGDRGEARDGPAAAGPSATAQALVPDSLAPPSGRAVRTGPRTVRFTWSVADPADVVGYTVTRTDPGGGPRPRGARVTGTSFDLTGLTRADVPCLDVKAVGQDSSTSAAGRICLAPP